MTPSALRNASVTSGTSPFGAARKGEADLCRH